MLAAYEGRSVEPVTTAMRMIGALDFIFLAMELVCYVYIFGLIRAHDDTMLREAIISMETYKRRQRLSSFTMTSQAYIFAVKLVYMIILNLALILSGRSSSIDVLELANALRVVQFGIISTVQVFFSAEIRRDFLMMSGRLFSRTQ